MEPNAYPAPRHEAAPTEPSTPPPQMVTIGEILRTGIRLLTNNARAVALVMLCLYGPIELFHADYLYFSEALQDRWSQLGLYMVLDSVFGVIAVAAVMI